MESDRFTISNERYSKMSSNVLKGQFVLLFQKLKKQFKQLEEIQEERNHIPDENSDFVNLGEGHLI